MVREPGAPRGTFDAWRPFSGRAQAKFLSAAEIITRTCLVPADMRTQRKLFCMTLPISGRVSTQPAARVVPAPALTTRASQLQPSSDTVLLSQSAQISEMYLQGQNPVQIAENLGIPESTVSADLKILATFVGSGAAETASATASAKGA